MLLASALFADGFIMIPPRPEPRLPRVLPTPFPLSVKYHRVNVDIKGSLARTSVDQEFVNPTGMRLEGTYIFPLPAGAVISDFSMEIDGKLTRAELLDAGKARAIYEDIVRSMRDPALLEYIGNGAFKVRIFPIEPRSTKRVKLSYSEVIRQDSGLSSYTYPLNTEKFSAAPLDDVAIRVNIESDRGLKTIFCPTHEVEIRRKGNKSATVGFEAKQTKPDKDFTLFFSTDDKGVGLSVLTHREPGEDGYFLLTVTPAYDTSAPVLPKDVTFVVDTSGSMAGAKMDQAKRALRFCLANLNAEDRFEIVRFSTEAEAMFGALRTATRSNVLFAQNFVDDLEPIGGTNSEEALTLALKTNAGNDSSRPKVVIFMTDGKPTIGETNEDQLVKRVRDANARHVRVFTFGIGDDLNTHFLDKLTEATRAARTYVTEKEDLEIPVSNFFEKIKSPVLVDVGIQYGTGIKAARTYPRDLPDLFKGSQLVVLGRYTGSGDSVMLTGTVDGKKVSFVYPASFGTRDTNEHIPPLWAAQRIGYLLDEIRLRGQERELVDEVTTLARRHGIITPYTSYLVMEDERHRVARENHTFAAPPPPLSARMKGDYDAMSAKAGAPSVQASREVEALKNAQNVAQTKQGTERMGKLAANTKNIQGRAVYQVGENWVDSNVQAVKNTNVQRIQFASAAYFDLLKKEPLSAAFLALGRNVRFALKNQIYEVFE